VLTLINLDGGDRIAMAFVRMCIELAWAAIFARAIDQLAAGELPIDHADSPSSLELPIAHRPKPSELGASAISAG
jgi:hypothetical protein